MKRANTQSEQWKEDSRHWRGVVIEGKFAHWCSDWDGLPVDETTIEFSACHCFTETEEIKKLKELVREKYREMKQDAE